jgi:hypothetical protein
MLDINFTEFGFFIDNLWPKSINYHNYKLIYDCQNINQN